MILLNQRTESDVPTNEGMDQTMSRWIFYGNRAIKREREVLLEPKEENNPTDLTTPEELGV